jgi:hypothetical protein
LLADTVGNLAVALIGNFLRRMPWYFRGWPMSSVKFLDGALRDQAWRQLHDDKRRFDHIAGKS